MIKNYFKVTIRNLFKHKFQSLLNIICLAIGMASILIIFAYVKYEFSYDKFNKDSDKIFRVERHVVETSGIDGYSALQVGPLGPELKTDCSEINDYTRIYQNESPLVVRYKDKISLVNAEGACWVDASFLTIFDCTLLKGDKNALKELNTIVLTESVARSYFGEDDPLGKSMMIDNVVYQVTGVCSDAPQNTHFHYKYLLSYSTLINTPGYEWLGGWRGGGVFLYVKLNPDFNKVTLENKVLDIYKKYVNINFPNILKFDLILRPITDIHLHCEEGAQLEKNTDIKLIRLIFITAIFILLISLVNAINLATSKSLERAKEVGIRKVVGGFKTQLVYQFLVEFLFMNIIAMVIAIIIFMISPLFVNNIFSSFIFLPLEILKEGWIWILIILLLIVNVIISGLYPAFVLSSYKPISVLRGKFISSSAGIVLKKCLIVFQFIITIGLIAGVITVTRQLNAMQSKNLGFDINKILIINGPTLEPDSTYFPAFESFKMELLKYNTINSISVSNDIPGKMPMYGLTVSLNKSMEDYTPGYLFYCGYKFLDVYGMKILAGRNFSESFGSDNRDAVIINEKVSKGLNFKNPYEAIDKILYMRDRQYKIIGVIADYNQVSPKIVNTPIVIRLSESAYNYISINLNQVDNKNSLDVISNSWKRVFPNSPFNYYFLNDFYTQQYSLDIQFGNIMNFFTIITIIIICLGLWALSTHTISVRTKEIAIRRVLNANPLDIILLLFRYFFNLILIGMVISLPIAYYIFKNWLNNFAYKTPIGWWFFVVPVLLITVITILIIGYGIIKVSIKNPAETLKYE